MINMVNTLLTMVLPIEHAGQTAPVGLTVAHGACHSSLKWWMHHGLVFKLWRPDCPMRALQRIALNPKADPWMAACNHRLVNVTMCLNATQADNAHVHIARHISGKVSTSAGPDYHELRISASRTCTNVCCKHSLSKCLNQTRADQIHNTSNRIRDMCQPRLVRTTIDVPNKQKLTMHMYTLQEHGARRSQLNTGGP